MPILTSATESTIWKWIYYGFESVATIIKNEIEARFDHKNLNLDCPEFKETFASTENFAWVIYGILKPSLPAEYQLSLTLFETERNYVEIGE